MVPNDPKTEVVPPAEVPEDLPLPSDPKVIFLGGLFVLAVLAAAYIVSEIVLPLVFAIVLKLLLQPALRALERLHVPRILAALLLILALFGGIVGLGTAISGLARAWAARLPEGIPRLEERLSFLRAPINTVQLFLQQVENIGETGPTPNGAISEQGMCATASGRWPTPRPSSSHAASDKKIEMRFAHVKRIFRLDRLRLRGLSGARDEVLLTATAQNLRRLVKFLCRPPLLAAQAYPA